MYLSERHRPKRGDMEITTNKTTQEIFNSLIETASRKYGISKKIARDNELAKEYEDEWNGIIEAIAEAFDIDIVKVIKETTKK